MSPEDNTTGTNQAEVQDPATDGPGDALAHGEEKSQGGDQQRPQRLNDLGGRAILTLQGAYDKLVAGRITQIQSQLVDQDRELSETIHDVAELSTQITQMNRRLQELEDRLARLETGPHAAEGE